MKIIGTPRLIIKSLCVDDISKKYIEWLNDEEVNKYLETRFQVQNNQSCLEFVKKNTRRRKRGIICYIYKQQ